MSLERHKYKAIILVIASPSNYYNKNKRVMMKFMNKHPDIKTFFIYGRVPKSSVPHCKHDLFFNCSESLRPGILIKSLMAFTHILKNYDFDYVVRTNISTFWNFEGLSKVLDKLPKTNCLAGRVEKHRFITGTNITISKDLVEYITQNTNRIRIHRCDDVEISQFFKRELKTPFIRVKRCDLFIKNFPTRRRDIPKTFVCYRLKTPHNRLIDSKKMERLYQVFYKKRRRQRKKIQIML